MRRRLLAAVLLASGLVKTQQPPEQPVIPPAAATVDLAALRQLAAKWLASKLAYDTAANAADRARLGTESAAAKAEFVAATGQYDSSTGKPLLLDAEALREVLQDACRPGTPPPPGGAISFREFEPRSIAEFVPPGYEGNQRYPTVLLLADATGRGSRDALQALVRTTWLDAASREPTLVIAPELPADLDLDGLGERVRRSDTEDERLRAALAPLGLSMRALHVDRERLVLDCGKGASAFALRLAGWFPDRFAGLVLRWPTLDESIRLDAVAGLPVLLVRCDETAPACTKLAAKLNGLAAGSCYTLTPRGAYPFGDEAGIAEWVRQCRRKVMTSRVVVAPQHDRFRRNGWVQIDTADPVDPSRLDRGPLLVAEADRKANRITVTTRGVQSFRLLLGPDLVDVREFQLVVDGKSETVKRKPSLELLVTQLTMRSDPGFLVTATHQVKLP